MTNKVCRIKLYLLYNAILPGTYINISVRGEVKANNTMVKNIRINTNITFLHTMNSKPKLVILQDLDYLKNIECIKLVKFYKNKKMCTYLVLTIGNIIT